MTSQSQTQSVAFPAMETDVQPADAVVVPDLGGPSWFAQGDLILIQDTGSPEENAAAEVRARRSLLSK